MSNLVKTVTAPSDEASSLNARDLYQRYKPLVLRRVLRFYDRGEAEDVVQEVFVKVMEQGDAFRGESSPTTWLYRIATNHCLNRLRDAGRRRELLQENAPMLSARRQQASQHAAALLEQIWAKVDDDELRQIAVYHYVDGMTHAEIARVLDVSRRTVGNRLNQLTELARAMTS